MTTYYYLVASQKFLEELDEVFKERERNYREKGKEIDFWRVQQPVFLETPAFAEIKAKTLPTAAAIISLDRQFIVWLKLRLEYVVTGQFEAPNDNIPDPFASLTSAR